MLDGCDPNHAKTQDIEVRGCQTCTESTEMIVDGDVFGIRTPFGVRASLDNFTQGIMIEINGTPSFSIPCKHCPECGTKLNKVG